MGKKASVTTAVNYTAPIDGTDYVLVASLNSVRAINRVFGGISPAFAAVRDTNFDAMAQVIACGVQREMKGSEVTALGEAIWRMEDRSDVAGAIVDFLSALNRGGRPPKSEDDTEDEAKGDASGN